jgi:hypothetical protein
MTFLLNMGTIPDGLPIKADVPFILIGDYRVSLLDFLAMAEYVLQNCDLEPDDPRLTFIEHVKGVKQKAGWMRGQKRLVLEHGPKYATDWRPRRQMEYFAELSAQMHAHPTCQPHVPQKPTRKRRVKKAAN